MRILVRSQEMAEIDQRAQAEFSMPGVVLMENAGIKLVDRLLELYRREIDTGTTVFLVGKGNNGGDALVMARQLAVRGIGQPEVVLLPGDRTGNPQTHLAACRALGVPVRDWPGDEARRAIRDASVLVDGMFGTGIRGALRGAAADIVQVAAAEAPVRVAVDVPSGVSDDFAAGSSAFPADTTLTVELLKRCLYLPAARRYCGVIEAVPIGFPPQLLTSDGLRLLEWRDIGEALPSLPMHAYKNSRGVVGVFAGAVGTSGAAALAAEACARSRAGLVHLFVDPELYTSMASKMGSVLVHVLEQNEAIRQVCSAFLVGPGWGRAAGREEILRQLVSSGTAGVLDADGLNLLSDLREQGDGFSCATEWVLTPHPGEAARLTGVETSELLSDPVPASRRLALEANAVVVFKSHVTYIVPPQGTVFVCDGMNPALGTGGSGDILAGTIAATLGAGASALDAAVAGVLAHTEAGRRCRQENGWFLADDLPREIGRLLDEVY